MIAEDDDPFAEFEKQFEEQDLTDTLDFSTLTDLELLSRFSDVRGELYKIQEMMDPRTDRGRELHSERLALLIIMRSRGLE